ncbi:MAG: carboxypeptidase-like regulatory domain-containing protein [Kiritimatiellae bacterium]|nr:carboxypeptidase-like regulatory domain-containing protein [Kiritimatiellia bacterium]
MNRGVLPDRAGLCLLLVLVIGVLAVGAARAREITLRGRVTLDGAAPAGWSVRAEESDSAAQTAAAPRQALATNGAFELTFPCSESDDYRLLVVDETGRTIVGWPHINKDRNFQTVAVSRNAELTGSVYGDGGKPLPNCEVLLELRLTAGCTHYVETARAHTAADGSFAFSALALGRYRCRVVSDSHASSPREIEVNEEFAFVEIHAEPGGVVTGRVLDDAGKPLAGARVYAGDGASGSVFTSTNGQYRISGLQAGDRTLRIMASNYVIKAGDDVAVKLGAGAVVERDIQMIHAAGLRLSLTGATAAVAVPASVGVRLTMMQTEPNRSHSQHRTVSVRNGVIALSGLRPGDCTVTLDAELGKPSIAVKLESGRETRAGLILPIVSTLSGQLVDEAGLALSNANVTASMVTETRRRRPRRLDFDLVDRHLRASTGSDGRFAVSGLTTGKWNVTFSHPDCVSTSEQVVVPIAAGSARSRYVLSRGATFSGRVVDETGKPVGEVALTMTSRTSQDDGGSQHTSTDADGRFRLTGLPPGNLELRISSDSHLPLRQNWDTLPPDDPARTLVLSNGLVIAGQVSDADGKPVPEVDARVFGPMRNQARVEHVNRTTKTGADGTFKISGLPAGSYRLTLGTEGETYSESDVTAGTDDVLVQLAAKMQICCEVARPDGAPLPGATVRAERVEEGGARMVFGPSRSDAPSVTDNKGRLTLTLRQGSRYTIMAAKPPLLPAGAKIDLTAAGAGATSVVLRLSEGVTLTGWVFEPDGRTPRAGVTVSADPDTRSDPLAGMRESDEDAVGAVQTGADGAFSLPGVAEGLGMLSVFADAERQQLLGSRRFCVKRDAPESVRVVLDALGAVRGKVLNKDGDPVPAGATVMLMSDDMQELSSRGGPARTETDDHGGFLFERIRAGSYRLMYYDQDAARSDGQRIRPIFLAVTVRPSETNVVSLAPTAAPASTLTGSVTRAGKPVSGGRIRMIPAPKEHDDLIGMMMAGEGVREAEVATNGTYSIAGIGPGEWMMRFSEARNEEQDSEGAYVRTVTVAPGQTRLDLDTAGVRLSGTVAAAGGGTATGDAVVRIVPSSGGAMAAMIGHYAQRTVKTDGAGMFEATDMAPGHYDLAVQTGNAFQTLMRGLEIGDTNVNVKLEILPAFELTGRVTDADNAGCARAFVFIMAEEIEDCRMEQTDAEGRYRVDPPLTAGEYTFFVLHGGHSVEATRLTVVAGATNHDAQVTLAGDLAVKLTGVAARVKGRVVRVLDAGGREVLRARAGYMLAVPTVSACAIKPTDDDGHTIVRGLRPGSYRIKVDGATAEKSVEVKALGTAEISLAVN